MVKARGWQSREKGDASCSGICMAQTQHLLPQCLGFDTDKMQIPVWSSGATIPWRVRGVPVGSAFHQISLRRKI